MAQELLGELVREGCQSRPSRLALVWRDQEYSYMTLDGEIDRVAEGFERLNVVHGDRVAFYAHNLPQFVIGFYALQRLGAVAVPINIYWKGRDLQYFLKESRVIGVITILPLYERIKEIQENLPELKWVVVISGGAAQPTGTIAWDELSSGPMPEEPVYTEIDAIEPAVITFSGGRTGPSRPVMLSHFNLLANCQQMQDLAQLKFLGDNEEMARQEQQFLPGASQQEVALLPLPLFNLFSLNIGLNLMYMLQGTVILMERFDPAQALELIVKHGCTVVFGSPAIFSEILNAPEAEQANFDSLRYCFSFGLPLATEVNEGWKTRTGKPIYNCYGLTEASPLLCCEAAGSQLSRDSVGPALAMVQLDVIGANGEGLAAGQVGELMAKGPNMMLGYFNPAAPDQPIIGRQDGWFATGDLAYHDEAGNFHIIDRKEDSLLLPNGDLVVPHDIERVLQHHPGVWQAAALPYTTKEGRNRMIAFVVLTEEGAGLTEPQLLHFVESRLPALLAPERIFFFREDDLLRLPNGAVWRRALRLQIPSYL